MRRFWSRLPRGRGGPLQARTKQYGDEEDCFVSAFHGVPNTAGAGPAALRANAATCTNRVFAGEGRGAFASADQ
eukprot:11169608-Lingulodinium_polyedra.AAC.1